MNRFALEEETRLTKWFPVAEKLQIPVPETLIVPATYREWFKMLDGGSPPKDEFDHLKKAAEEIGYPVFIRSDMASAKHSSLGPPTADHEGELSDALYSIVEEHEMNWIPVPYKVFAVREFLNLVSHFEAFAGTPIAKERRLFIRDGKLQCYHPYWPEKAIKFWDVPEPDDWKEKLAELNTINAIERQTLTVHAERIGKELGDYWSVDFAEAYYLGELRKWYLIDMARGEISYHWEGCEYA